MSKRWIADGQSPYDTMGQVTRSGSISQEHALVGRVYGDFTVYGCERTEFVKPKRSYSTVHYGHFEYSHRYRECMIEKTHSL